MLAAVMRERSSFKMFASTEFSTYNLHCRQKRICLRRNTYCGIETWLQLLCSRRMQEPTRPRSKHMEQVIIGSFTREGSLVRILDCQRTCMDIEIRSDDIVVN